MIASLTTLTLTGSAVAAVVWLVDRLSRRRVCARTRRLWWWLVPVSFLVPWQWRVWIETVPGASVVSRYLDTAEGVGGAGSRIFAAAAAPMPSMVPTIWLAGMGVGVVVVSVRTITTWRRWSRVRLSTDPALLGLLEDCKAAAGVTAPIGLVVSAETPAPALLGWLRPRILLPETLSASLTPAQLRAVLMHELAHFRSFDVPVNWAFTCLRIVHWFNPVAHLAAGAWLVFREEAADEAAIDLLPDRDGRAYGDALIQTLRHSLNFSLPAGALAIGESNKNLKQRIAMILDHPRKSALRAFTLAFAVLIMAAVFLRPARADTAAAEPAAIQAMETWMESIDAGNYGQSWEQASALFRKAVTKDQWIAAAAQARAPLATKQSRTLVSAKAVTELPGPKGGLKGEFVVCQFNSAYENLSPVVETVTFEKEKDGVWRASGYFIRPAK